MAIPDYQTLMLPVLRFYSDGQEHSFRSTIDTIGKEMGLSDKERTEMLPSGQQAIFDNRVGWARTYLKKAGLIESTRRGYNKITSRGIDILRQNPERIDVELLERFEEFQSFRALRHTRDDIDIESRSNHQTPEESLETAFKRSGRT